MTITVTDKDIIKGSRASRTSCPVALAINRAIPDNDYEVGCYTLSKRGDPDKYIAYLPIEATEQIIEFDNDRGMKPFSFELNII